MEENIVINVSSWVSSVQDESGNSHVRMLPTNCIFKTPSILFRHSPSAFLPNCFSIGPVHHGKENLVAADKIKIIYVINMLIRVARLKNMFEEELLNELVDTVKAIKKEASSYYAGQDFLAQMGDEFSEMLLLDGCFLIELFRKGAGEVKSEEDDPIFSTSCMLQFLNHDLILLENQIPWLVLQTLFDKTKLPSETKFLTELSLKFFANLFLCYPSNLISYSSPIFISESGQSFKHSLDLFRWSLVSLCEEFMKEPKQGWQPILSVTRLKEAGVKFKKVVSNNVLDIKFRNGILEIPSLMIKETTETILRNLIAYEQCLPNCKPIFTSYAKFLKNLIDTPRDIEILCQKEIFDNWLRPEDAAQYFTNLCLDTYVSEFYYSNLCDELNVHCKRWWPRCRAHYARNYFSKPWAIATMFGFIMFILALWQTLGNLPHKSSQ